MVKEHLKRDRKHALNGFKMAATELEEIELQGERGTFAISLTPEDLKGLNGKN